MKITFSVPKQQLPESGAQLLEELRVAIPEASVQLWEDSGLLAVLLPDDTDRENAVACLRLVFSKHGITATEQEPPKSSFLTARRESGCFDGAEQQAKKQKSPKTVRLSVFWVSLIAVAVLLSFLTFTAGVIYGGVLGDRRTLGTGEQDVESYVGKISLIDQMFESFSVYDTDGQALLDAMLKAYVEASGDKYAAYYTKEEADELFREMSGSAVGIGVTVTKDPDSDNILVIQVAPDTPAAEAGVLPGDVIVKIGTKAGGTLVAEVGYDLAIKQMAGEAGTVLSFVVLRDGEEVEISATRTAITIRSVFGNVSETDSSVGIVRITSFQAKTPLQFKETMNALISAGCDRFVFDLRNNLGGEQRSILAILSYFANEGDILLCTVEKGGTTTYEYALPVTNDGDYADCSVSAEEIGMYRQYKSVVLTNGYTASAAELFTGTLLDFGLTTQVGETTFGKGVKQSMYDLSSFGYGGVLSLTTGYYAPPKGVNYDGIGLIPTVSVAPDESILGKNPLLLTEEQDNQLSAAIATVLEK